MYRKLICGISLSITFLFVFLPSIALAQVNASPNPSTTGNFTLSWTDSSIYQSYSIIESYEGGSATPAGSTSGGSYSFTGKAAGNYTYTVLGQRCTWGICFAETIGRVSVAVNLITAPGVPPSFSSNVGSTANFGSYTFTWGNSSGTVTAYELYERPQGSSNWTRRHNSTSRSKGFSKTSQSTYFDYRLRACNQGVCSGYTSIIRVNIPAASLSASGPSSVLTYSDDNISVSWSSVMTTGCAVNNSNHGHSGSTTVNLGSGWVYNGLTQLWDNSFQVSCGVIGNGTVSQTINVHAYNKSFAQRPTVSTSWDRSSAFVGEIEDFRWQISGAHTCTLDSVNIPVDTNGSEEYTFTSDGTHSHTVICSNNRGSTSSSASISVSYPPLPIASIYWDDTTARVGESSTIAWEFSGASSCIVEGVGTVNSNSSTTVPHGLHGELSRSISCSNVTGSTQDEATIMVLPSSTNTSDFPLAQDPADDLSGGTDFWGYLNGSFNVSPSGSASYSVPIEVPPGIRNMQPNMALVYNNNASNGIAGWGWNISGLSRIHRCSANLAKDNYVDGVRDGDQYKLCIDGQRLIEIANGEYRTERESYRKIVESGNGFLVYLRDGRVFEYGQTNDARRDSADQNGFIDWHINKITDIANNYMTFHYEKVATDGIHRIQRVEYTKNNGATGINQSVEFNYQDRPDKTNNYWAGVYSQQDKRLHNIRVLSDGGLVRKYNLNYQAYDGNTYADPSQTSRLTEINVCYDDYQNTCSEPLSFEWNNFSSNELSFAVSDFANGIGTNTRYSYADYDADGVNEMLVMEKTGTVLDFYLLEKGETLTRSAAQNRGSFETGSTTQHNLAHNRDLNGDGRADLIIARNINDPYQVSYMTQTGDFSTPQHFLAATEYNSAQSFQLRDMNGDGFLDIFRVPDFDGTGTTRFEVALGDGQGSFANFVEWGYQNSGQPNTIKLADMNGDGLIDVVRCNYQEPNCGFIVSLNNGNGFDAQVYWHGVVDRLSWSRKNNPDNTPIRIAQHMVLADVNGDRTADMVWASETNVQVALNNGEGFEPKEVWLNVDIAHEGWGSLTNVWQKPAPFTLSDINMDGRLDLMYRDLNENVFVAYNRGSYKNNGVVTALGFSTPQGIGIVSQDFWGMDTNADGVTDINFGRPGSFSINGATYTGAGIAESSISRHVISQINVNSEHSIVLEYKPLTDTSAHTPHTTVAAGYSQSAFGNAAVVDDVVFDETTGTNTRNISSIARTRLLVSKVDVSNGVGGTNTNEYHYTGHLRHLSGWGSLGFSEVQIDSTVNKAAGGTERSRTISTYNQEVGAQYNASGLLLEQEQFASRQSGSLQRIAHKIVQWHAQTFNDDVDSDGYNSPHYVLQRVESKSDTYDLEGGSFLATSHNKALSYIAAAPTQCSALSASVTASSSAASGYDAYGNLAQSASIACQSTNTFVSRTRTQYENRTTGGDWILGLVTNAQTTNTAPDENGTQQSLTREVARTYTSIGLPATETREPNNSNLYRRTSFSNYDAYGTPQTITENWNSSAGLGFPSRSSTINVSYQNDGTRTVTATNALSHSSTSVVDGRFGQAISMTDSNNLTTTTTFDAMGRVAAITMPDSTTVSTSYKACNNCESEVPNARFYIHQKATGASSERAYYDAFSRAVGQRSFGLLGDETFAVTEYDAAGRVKRASNPFFAGGTRHFTETEYDSLGRSIQVIATNNGLTQTSYDGFQVTVTKSASDIIDEQSNTTWYNGIGQVSRVQDDNGTEISYAYDAFGNLIYTEIENVETHMGYDSIGRQLYLDDPSAGRTDYTYNGLDLMATSTDAKNQRTEFTYDALGRQITRVDNAGAGNPADRTQQWFYDTPNSGEGRLDSVVGFDTDGDSYQENYSYNAFGLPTELETIIKDTSYLTTTYYDAFNRPVAIEYPTGYIVVNNFNNYGHRHQVTDYISGELLWIANEVDAFGNITLSTHGNNVVTESEFDENTGLVNSIYASKDTGSSLLLVQNQDFHFDTLGNLKYRDDHRVQYREAFCYDNLNRLVAARQDSCGPADRDITYDPLGNIRTRVMEGVVNVYSYENVANPYELTNTSLGGDYDYDDNGNIETGDGRTITYSSFDKPTRMTKDGNVVDITYGANHQRIQRVDNNSGSATVTTTYVAGIYEKQDEGTNTKHIHYIGDIALHIWEEESNTLADTLTRYLHLDHLGSIVAKTNEEANSVDDVEWLAYDAWGLRQDRSWMGIILGTGYVASDNRRGYTGHEHLDGVGLIHMNGRVYDPNIGRFLSADPLVQAPTYTQSFNRYAYVWNNPLSMTDPTGYEGCGGQAGNDPTCRAYGVYEVESGSQAFTISVGKNDNGEWEFQEGEDGPMKPISELSRYGAKLEFDKSGNPTEIVANTDGANVNVHVTSELNVSVHSPSVEQNNLAGGAAPGSVGSDGVEEVLVEGNKTNYSREQWRLRATIGEGEQVTIDSFNRLMIEMGDDASALHVNGFYATSNYVLLDENGFVEQEIWPNPPPKEFLNRMKTHYGFPFAGKETRHILKNNGYKIDQKFRWFLKVPQQPKTCDNCGGRYLNVWEPAGVGK